MTLLFDLDGPILDVSEKYYRVYFDLVCELGGEPLDKQDYWNRKRSRVPDSETLEASNIAGADVARFRQLRKDRIETRDYWKLDRVWPEMVDTMATSPLGGKLVLVTLRNRTDVLEEELAALGIRDWFKAVLATDGDADGPDRHSAKVGIVSRKFGNVSGGWFIGDTETDLRAGNALGLHRAAVTFGIRESALLEKEDPEKIFHHPSEMTRWLESLAHPTI